MPCRVNRRRVWMHRILLEMYCHSDNAFITLTYADDELSFSPSGEATLVPRDLMLFLKRLRKAYEPIKLRFFACGEYGDVTERPHYHAAIFGMPSCRRGNTVYTNGGRCCDVCDGLAVAWGKGRIHVGDLNRHTAQYVAGYVTKKMTKADDPRLRGRVPEFSRQSNRPGIGADFMHDVASSILANGLEDDKDVPLALRHGGKELPLGRYLRRKLRSYVGRDPNLALLEINEHVQEMLSDKDYFASGESLASWSVKQSAGKYEAFEARQRFFRKERKL